MKYAFNLDTGKLITLERLVELRADEIRKAAPKDQTAALNRDLRCPECRNPVHAYGLTVVGDFKLAGVQVGNPSNRPDVVAGFHHYHHPGRRSGDKPLEECSLYKPMDPRFSHLERKEKSPEIVDAVKAVLCSKEVVALNRPLLEKLYKIAAWNPLSEEERRRMIGAATRFYGNDALIEHPWILPFALMGTEPAFVFKKKNGKGEYKAALRGVGVQELKYKSFDGREKVIVLPEALQRFYVNKNGGTSVIEWDKRLYPISKDDAYRIAGVPLPTGMIEIPVGTANRAAAIQAYDAQAALLKKATTYQGPNPPLFTKKPVPQLLPGFLKKSA